MPLFSKLVNSTLAVTSEPEPSTSENLQNVSQSIHGQSISMKPKSTHKNKKAKSDECRLRNLNDDCLLEIFKYLDIDGMINLSAMDIYFKDLIANRVIRGQWIDFSTINIRKPIFRMYGKKMRKIRIDTIKTRRSFNQFLNFIIKYCSVGTLTAMTIRHSINAPVNILEKAMPFFTNLQELQLWGSVKEKIFMERIAMVATNLTHLSLDDVNIDFECPSAGLENLRELRIGNSRQSNLTFPQYKLAEFLRTKSRLEVFRYIGFIDIRNVFNALADNCPKLREFSYFHMTNPFHPPVPNISADLKEMYNFLREFRHLKKVGLTSYTVCGSDLYYPLQILAIRNQIEVLYVYTNRKAAIKLLPDDSCHQLAKQLPHFSEVKSVTFCIQGHHQTEEFDFNGDFNCELISKLVNVQQFRVVSDKSMYGINDVIDMAPNLKILNVSNCHIFHRPLMGAAEIALVLQSIKKHHLQRISDGEKKSRPIHLVVNTTQLYYLQSFVGDDGEFEMPPTSIEK